RSGRQIEAPAQRGSWSGPLTIRPPWGQVHHPRSSWARYNRLSTVGVPIVLRVVLPLDIGMIAGRAGDCAAGPGAEGLSWLLRVRLNNELPPARLLPAEPAPVCQAAV